MKTGYRKILRDLWREKGRTLLVVLSITVGVFAVGLVAAMGDLMVSDLTGSFRDSNPAHITLWLRGAITDESVLDNLARLPGVAGVEGIAQLGARWRPDPNSPWRDATILVRDDYAAQKYNRLQLTGGHWPGRRTIAVEGTTIEYYGIAAGSTIEFQIDERERTAPIDGVVRDLLIYPPAFGGDATFYISTDLMESWYGSRFFNQIKVQTPAFSQTAAEDTA